MRKLGDICNISSSKRIFENEYVSDGIPFVRGQEITDGSLKKTDTVFECYISVERYNQLKNTYGVPHIGDILITAVGTIGNMCYIDFDTPFYFKDGNIISLNNFSQGVSSKYIYYFMQSDFFQKQIRYGLIGAVQKALTMVMLKNIDLDLPPYNKQLEIVQILEYLDSKIENNNKICAELENMAKTLYDYWFVQFDFPDENGKPYKTSGGKMTYNEQLKREIPYDWNCGSIGELGKIVSGATPSTKVSENYTINGFAWATPNDLTGKEKIMFFSHGERDITLKGLNSCSTVLLPKGSVLMSSRAPIGYLAIAENEVCTNQGFKSVVPNEDYGTAFVYYTLKHNMQRIIQQGSGTTFMEVSASVLANVKIVLPPTAHIKTFCAKTESILERRKTLEQENRELASLRDFLLPMLMNGQVTIK